MEEILSYLIGHVTSLIPRSYSNYFVIQISELRISLDSTKENLIQHFIFNLTSFYHHLFFLF